MFVILVFDDRFCLSFFVAMHHLEKVTLTTIKFRIYPRTKVDPMFYSVYISMPLKAVHTKVVQLVLDLW